MYLLPCTSSPQGNQAGDAQHAVLVDRRGDQATRSKQVSNCFRRKKKFKGVRDIRQCIAHVTLAHVCMD